MKRYTAFFSTALLAVAVLTASCQDDLENFENNVFLGETEKVETVLVVAGEDVIDSYGISASIAKPEGHNVDVTFQADGGKVGHYNMYYSENAEMLPAGYYEIPNPTVTIEAGRVSSPKTSVIFKNLTSLDLSKDYVLPVTVANAGAGILASQSTVYYVLQKSALVNYAANLRENNLYVDWKDGSVVNDLSTMTVEALVRMDAPADGRGSNISTILGVEGKFLLRAGDSGSGVPGNQLQFAASSNVTSSDWTLTAGKWTHIALTYNASTKLVELYIDGKKKTPQTFAGTPGNVSWGMPHTDEADGERCFWIGYSFQAARYLDGAIAEVRIWNRVLTAEEIQAENHAYTVEPDADGLVAYWKFNEGQGNTVKDQTANGNDATASGSLTWENVALPAE